MAVAGCATPSPPDRHEELRALARQVGGFSPRALARLERTMAPDMVVMASRLERGAGGELAGRPQGWTVLDLVNPPNLGFAGVSPEEALRINAFLPASNQPPPPVAPFYLTGAPAERQRALLCLTQTIYYEAALEPLSGQEAVAQTVLNRVRNPLFPNSICGVVYQGSQQVTGCQFSFTCDGSRQRAPVAAFWREAQAVAGQALSGLVMPAVGTATHYHADYVFPRWGPTLVKIGQIGAHIFYRFPGPAGMPASFRRPYGGDELRVSMAGPSPEAVFAARAAAALGQGGQTAPVQFAVADPTAPNGLRQRVAGEIVFGRRLPTREEVARIDAFLAAMEKATAQIPPAQAPAARRSPAPSASPAAAQSSAPASSQQPPVEAPVVQPKAGG